MLTASMLLVACCAANAAAQVIEIGPGPVDPISPGDGNYRFLAGTEIISHGTSMQGGRAVYTYGSDTYTFDGGRYEGATITAAAAQAARGGDALDNYTSSDPTIVINDGVFRGGSVIASPPLASLANLNGGNGIHLGGRYTSHLSIYGGVFEGGIVALSSTPDVPIKRAPAIQTGGHIDVSRHLIDVYGGTFLGNVRLTGSSVLTVHGSALVVQPDIDGNFRDMMFTITGRYADGTQFSHTVDADPYRMGVIRRGPNFLAFEMLLPEPSSVSLMIAAGAFLGVRRRRPEFGA